METGYNYYLELAAVFFVAILYLYQLTQYPILTVANKRFRQLTALVLSANLLDITSSICISYGKVIPLWINLGVTTAYLATVGIMMLFFMRYLEAYIRGQEGGIIFYISHIMCFIFLTGLLVNLFTGEIFCFDENGEYLHGPRYYLIYAVPVIFTVIGCLNLIYNREKFEKRQLVSAYIYIIFTCGSSILQAFFFSDVLLTMFSCSLALIIFLFANETPNYQKLSETMKKLEEARKEAEIATDYYKSSDKCS